MKVLHVITSMRTGGAENLVAAMLPRLRTAGIEPSLALLDATPTPLLSRVEDAGIEVFRLGRGLRSVYNPLHIRRLASLMQNGRFDIVHTHNSTPQFFARWARPGNGPKLVTTEHNTSNRRRGIPGFHIVDLDMYRAYDAIVCCGEAVMTALLERHPSLASHKHIEVIANGIDLTPYISLMPPYPPADRVEILMVSAFRPQKDHVTALRAIAMLPPRFHLTLAGDGQLLKQTMALAESLGVADKVCFAGNRTDIPSLYSGAHIALLSTHYEGLSLGCIEAMASGRPFVASDVRGVREITSGVATLTPEADPFALAEAINRVADNYTAALPLASAARAKATIFDIENTVKQYINLYTAI